MSKLMLPLILVVLCTSGFANDQKTKAETRSITGCLSKGDSSNEYLLTGTDGSKWEVTSKSVDLAKHIGHTVTATGKVSHNKMHNLKEDAQQAAKDTGMTKSNREEGDLKVTGLEMVSDSCSQ